MNAQPQLRSPGHAELERFAHSSGRAPGPAASRDTDQIAAWADQARPQMPGRQDAIANPKKIKAARGFLTGQVMKLSGGKADPKIVGELIEEEAGRKTGGNH